MYLTGTGHVSTNSSGNKNRSKTHTERERERETLANHTLNSLGFSGTSPHDLPAKLRQNAEAAWKYSPSFNSLTLVLSCCAVWSYNRYSVASVFVDICLWAVLSFPVRTADIFTFITVKLQHLLFLFCCKFADVLGIIVLLHFPVWSTR